MKTKLTDKEKDAVLKVLITAEDIFEYDEHLDMYVDGGNFLCSFESAEDIKALKRGIKKILMQ